MAVPRKRKPLEIPENQARLGAVHPPAGAPSAGADRQGQTGGSRPQENNPQDKMDAAFELIESIKDSNESSPTRPGQAAPEQAGPAQAQPDQRDPSRNSATRQRLKLRIALEKGPAGREPGEVLDFGIPLPAFLARLPRMGGALSRIGRKVRGRFL